MKHVATFFVSGVLLAACSSHPIKPEAGNVKVSRDDADKDCKEIGPVEGRVKNVNGKFEEALEDMKLDGARKGANYIHMKQTGALGQAVSGTAYFCD